VFENLSAIKFVRARVFCMMVSETVKYSAMVGRKVTAISGTRRVKAWWR